MRKEILKPIIALALFGPWAWLAYRLFVECPWLSGDGNGVDLADLYTNTTHWTILTFGVLVYIILVTDFHPPLILKRSIPEATQDHHTKDRHVVLLGLVGGFAIALPALTITMLAFVTAFPHFIEQLRGTGPASPDQTQARDGGEEIALSSPENDRGSAYLLGVDVSGSFLKGESQTTNSDQTLKSIYSWVDVLFSRDPDRVLPPLVNNSDIYWSFAFAGEQYPLTQKGEPFQDIRASSFSRRFKDNLTAFLKPYPKEDEAERKRTDILSFLDSMMSSLKVKKDEYSHLTLIVFSDFIQDPQPGTPPSPTDIRTQVRKIMSDAEAIGGLHIVGISIPSEPSAIHVSGIDIRPYLDNYSGKGLWREISLNQFNGSDQDGSSQEKMRALLAVSIYREEKYPDPLYLKYQVVPWKPVSAKLRFPAVGYDGIQLGLRRSNGRDETLAGVRVRLGESEPIVLGLEGRESSFETLQRLSGAENPLKVTLQSPLNVSGPVECNLLVAVPSRALVHSIRVVILPVIGDLPMRIFRLSLRFIGSVLILLSLGAIGVPEILLASWRSWRKRAPVQLPVQGVSRD